MERETGHGLTLLDVVINNTDPHFTVTTIYRKNIHRFANQLSKFLSLYLQNSITQNPDW